MKKYRLGDVMPHRIGRWEYTLRQDGSVCLQRCHGNRDVLEIPGTLMGRPVTALGRGFTGTDCMVLMIIPPTVTSIGRDVCFMADDLQGVWIPPEVTRIDDSAFADCGELVIYTEEGSCAHDFALAHDIPVDLDGLPQVEGNGQELDCGDYFCARTEDGGVLIREYNGTETVVAVPAELDGCPVTGILSCAFHGNDFLQELILPEGLTDVGAFAFADCASLRSVRLPETLSFLGDGAFAHCCDLEEINFPPELDMIQMCAFIGCTSLREAILPENTRHVFPMAFHGCTALERVYLGTALESVAKSSFARCPSLRRPALPDTLDAESRQILEGLPG